jgi:hypothetical protein
MGSVQSEITCPNCKFEHAFSDYYYKSDEEYIMCGRCGYSYSRNVVCDIKKSKETFNEVTRLLNLGQINEAFKASDIQMISHRPGGVEIKSEDWSTEEKSSELKEWIDRMIRLKFRYFYKFTKDHKLMFREKEHKPTGAFRYKCKESPVYSCGSYEDLNKLREDIERNKDIFEVATYTVKQGDTWNIIDGLTGDVKPYDNAFQNQTQEDNLGF